jgi:hypothetical protein
MPLIQLLALSSSAISCSQKGPASEPVLTPAPVPIEQAEKEEKEEKPSSPDLTRPVSNTLGGRSLGGGDLKDISNRQPLDQGPIGDGGSLRTGSLGERSRGSVESGDISDMRGESTPELGDRDLKSDHLRDASREGGGSGDLGERNWQGHQEED